MYKWLVLIMLFVAFGCSDEPRETAGEDPSEKAKQELEQRETELKVKMTRDRMNSLLGRLDIYKVTMGAYPAPSQGLNALVTKPDFDNEAERESWSQLAQPEAIKDGWGNVMRYDLVEIDGKTQTRIESDGPDCMRGSDDDIVSLHE